MRLGSEPTVVSRAAESRESNEVQAGSPNMPERKLIDEIDNQKLLVIQKS